MWTPSSSPPLEIPAKAVWHGVATLTGPAASYSQEFADINRRAWAPNVANPKATGINQELHLQAAALLLTTGSQRLPERKKCQLSSVVWY